MLDQAPLWKSKALRVARVCFVLFAISSVGTQIGMAQHPAGKAVLLEPIVVSCYADGPHQKVREVQDSGAEGQQSGQEAESGEKSSDPEKSEAEGTGTQNSGSGSKASEEKNPRYGIVGTFDAVSLRCEGAPIDC